MIKILLLLYFGSTVISEPIETYCCFKEEGILADNEAFCVHPVHGNISEIHLKCSSIVQITEDIYNFTVNDDGTANLFLDDESLISHDVGTFCVANRTVNDTQRVLVLCQEDEEPPFVNDNILGYCMIVSATFLTITAVVYSILPSIRDLQGKSIISFCISLSLALIILSIMKLMEYSDMKLCATRGFLTYFFFLSSFFWTNAISIQILFRIKRPSVPDYSWRTFGWYALYAWGCPALLTICMAIVNFHPGKHQKPGIGLNTCWFYNRRLQWYYMYSVMTILIAANICIFIYLSLYLWTNKFSSTHVKELRYKFTMTLRLFIIMGLPWIFEMISSFFDKHIIWTVLDMFNLLQGFLIFIILVVLRKRVIKALYSEGMLECISGPVERYLAVADDDEGIVQHTTDVPLDQGRT